jgi:hypothetical protein
MPLDRQMFERSPGEAFADLLRQKYPSAKAMARALCIDITTAENARKGHFSARAFIAAVTIEGWEFLGPFGAELTGETYDQAQDRAITQKLEGALREREEIDKRRAHRETLEERTARLVDDLDRRLAP